MKKNKHIKICLLTLTAIFLSACSRQQEQKSVKGIIIKRTKAAAYIVSKDSVTEPPVFIINENRLITILAQKSKIVPANTNIHPVSGMIKIPAGPPLVISGQDNLLSPETVFAIDSPFMAGIPEVVMAKDAYIRDRNPQNFSSFSKLQGLKHDVISCMQQDRNGNLWFGTYGGVSKYDGKNFIHFTVKEGLSNNTVWSMLEDRDGNLWFGTTGGGVSKYDGQTFTHFTEREGLSNNIVLSMLEDRNGNLWFGTSNGVSKYDGRTFTHFTEEEGLSGNIVLSILEDRNGNLWFGTDGGGVSKYNGKAFIRFTVKEGLSDNRVFSMLEDRNGNFWFGTSGGVSKYDGQTFMHFTEKEGLLSNMVLSILEDRNGNLWFGTDGGGVSKYDGQSIINFTEEEGLSNNIVLSIFEDQCGNIWFGTYGGGVSKYGGQTFTHYTKKEGLSNNSVLAIFEDRNGNLWFGTSGGGISEYDTETFIHLTQKEGLSGNTVWSILEDQSGNLWFGTTGGGVSKYDGEFFTHFTEKDGLSNNTVLSILEDYRGNLWFGTEGGGVNKYDGKTFTHFTVKEGLSGNTVYSMLEDRSGNLWFGTSGGVDKYDGEFFTHYNVEEGLPNNRVLSMCEDREGNLWFGTYGGGVLRYDGKYFINFTEKEGLPNNTVLSILADQKGNLWFGTRFGLCKLPAHKKEKLFDFIDEDKKHYNATEYKIPVNEVFFKSYGYEDGFLGIGVNRGSTIYEASDGTIWIAANDRLTAYHPEGDVPDTIAPYIQLTGIELFGESIQWISLDQNKDTSFYLSNGIEVGDFEFNGITKWYGLPENLSLAYNNNNLTFNFIGITTKYPKKVKYQYMLAGMDKNWRAVTGKTSASYGNLPHGSYTFKVKAMNSEGFWSKEFTYNFEIRPPWWLTWWFRTMYITISVLALFGFYRWRTATMRKRQKELEQMVKKRTLELSEANEELNQQNEEIRSQRDEIEQQKIQIEEIHQEISQSIDYATRLQGAILPQAKLLEEYLSDYFVLFKPKDKVSGDFYWWAHIENHTIITVADCTGHGVPGAFMSMLGVSFLREIVQKEYITHTSVILRKLRKEVIKALNQKGESGEQKDGMDMAIISIEHETNTVQFSGANNPLYVITNRRLKKLESLKEFENFYEIRPDKMPIAIYEKMDKFTTHEIQLEKGDMLYMFSDGFADQFGGKKGKKFKYKPFKRLLSENRDKPMKEQKKILNKTFEDWKGNIEQVDDVVVLGVKI